LSLASDRRQLEIKQRELGKYEQQARGLRTKEEKELAKLADIRREASKFAKAAEAEEKRASATAQDITKLQARIAKEESRIAAREKKAG
jgi:hypothetical protein